MRSPKHMFRAADMAELGRRLGGIFQRLSRDEPVQWHDLKTLAEAERLLYDLSEREGWLGIALRKLSEE